eukprot:Skav209684  [mRNA]  locus=scaffold5822:15475:16087:+ [translate_table: standard]
MPTCQKRDVALTFTTGRVSLRIVRPPPEPPPPRTWFFLFLPAHAAPFVTSLIRTKARRHARAAMKLSPPLHAAAFCARPSADVKFSSEVPGRRRDINATSQTDPAAQLPVTSARGRRLAGSVEKAAK